MCEFVQYFGHLLSISISKKTILILHSLFSTGSTHYLFISNLKIFVCHDVILYFRHSCKEKAIKLSSDIYSLIELMKMQFLQLYHKNEI